MASWGFFPEVLFLHKLPAWERRQLAILVVVRQSASENDYYCLKPERKHSPEINLGHPRLSG